jgi:hypothetical protein
VKAQGLDTIRVAIGQLAPFLADRTGEIRSFDDFKQLTVGVDRLHSTAFSPDGSRIVNASQDKTARIWDAATAKEIAVLRGHDATVATVDSAAFRPTIPITASWPARKAASHTITSTSAMKFSDLRDARGNVFPLPGDVLPQWAQLHRAGAHSCKHPLS